MSMKFLRGFIEPPFLADRVAAGELPEKCLLLAPASCCQEEYGTWEDGQYGGDLVMQLRGVQP